MPYAQRSIELIRDTDHAMSQFTKQLKGRLQLGASLTIGEYILPRLLGPFGQEYPAYCDQHESDEHGADHGGNRESSA